MSPKARTFWPLLFVLLLTDCTTKELAVERLGPPHVSHSVLDSFVRFTLVYNPGTAFGFDLRPYIGQWARPVMMLGMVAVLIVLLGVYRRTSPKARIIAGALGLACGGAIGNLLDRARFPLGVVDFIDVGLGAHRFWIFNVADAGITVGAVVLGLMLIKEESSPVRGRDRVV